MSQNQSSVTSSMVTFPDGKQAVLVETPPGVTASEIIQTLDLKKPEAVILIPGGGDITDAGLQQRLFQLFSRGLVRAFDRNSAVVIDDGTASGIIAVLGKAVADRASKLLLLGVANDSQVARPDVPGSNDSSWRKMLEPNHTSFVLLKSSSPAVQISKMLEVAEELSQGVPILTILVNGSSAARDEVLRSIRQNRPILVIEGSGGFADEIQRAWQKKQDYRKKLAEWDPTRTNEPKPVPPFIDDPVLAEVVAEGDLQFFSITDTPENLEQYINLRLKGNILKQAYAQQRLYSTNAQRYQKTFRLQQNFVLGLGVFITALAALQSFFKVMHWDVSIAGMEGALYILLLIMPVVLAILIAGANRFNAGNKWIFLRTAAEAFEREIYRYRTQTGMYSDMQVSKNDISREVMLANMLESITKQWVADNLDFGALHPVLVKPSRPQSQQTRLTDVDSGFGYLSPDRYITFRLVDQLNYYKKNVLKLERKLFWLQWLILGLGGVATLLAALHVELLITVTTAGATALVTYLEYNQVTNTLKQYNYAILNLTTIQSWWVALGDAQVDPANIDKLVSNTETTLQSEQAGWVQQMQSALTELRSKQAKQSSDTS